MKVLKTLIIEDNDNDAELLLRHLAGEYEVQYQRVDTASAARAALTNEAWEIILSDFRMPTFSAPEALELVKELQPGVPFIIISGTIGEETAVSAMLAGADDFFIKGNLKRLIPAIERELREAQLRREKREAEIRLNLAISAAGLGVWEWNLVSDRVLLSPECYKIFEIEEFNGGIEDFLLFVVPEDRDRLSKLTRNAIDSAEHFNAEFRVADSQGNRRWLYNLGTVEYDAENRPLRMIGTVQDITERKSAESLIRESEENYRALIEASTLFTWTLDDNGPTDDAYELFDKLSGRRVRSINEIIDLIHPDDLDHLQKEWQNAVDKRSVFSAVARIRNKTGGFRYLAIRGVQVFNDDGSFRKWIGTINDITERKSDEERLRKSEEQLRQAQKLESIGRLAGGIAHDFNNMLTAISGYCELTLLRMSSDDPLRKNIEEIRKAGERSAALTNQLLTFSRSQILEVKTLDVNKIIEDSIVMLQRVIGEDVSIHLKLDADLWNVQGDQSQLTQVLLNLCVNSRDAMPRGGTITIKTTNASIDQEFTSRHPGSRVGKFARLSIADTGFGMDEETQKHIFEPFFTTKEIGKGTGLGLSMVYGIVKQLGGYVWVTSFPEGGSTFDIFLPQAAVGTKEEISEQKPGFEYIGSETILLVEDEDIVRELSRQLLESCGYDVIEASSGTAAVELVRSGINRLDLLMTDVVMPGMSGQELAEQLGDILPGLPVLFTSGYLEEPVPVGEASGGNRHFIQKPFSYDQLVTKVRSILDTK